jgi:hypothetical protein
MAAVPAVLVTALVAFPDALVGEPPEAYRTAGRFHRPVWTTEELLTTRWTMTAKIDTWSDSARDLGSGRTLGHPPPYRMITQDNDAHTNALGPGAHRRAFDAAERGESVEPLAILYSPGRTPEEGLVIGAGGGKDIVIARAYGAKAIDAVELNAATVDLVSNGLMEYAGSPGGRSAARRRDPPARRAGRQPGTSARSSTHVGCRSSARTPVSEPERGTRRRPAAGRAPGWCR